MARIQSSVGLISGIDIGNLVKQMMAVAARPRDLLIARTEKLENEQIAVTELSALLLATRYATDYLGTSSIYTQRQVVSSNPNVLSVTATGTPPLGNYQYTPLRTAQNHQLLSAGVASDTASLGGGSMTIRFGATVERGTPTELLNAGEGIVRGLIRITDRSGARADIDLRTAQTINDVLEAINANQTINVTAQAHGDGIRLIDHTGLEVSNLMVQEVGGGTTAASLGLAGISEASSVVDGQDLVRLYADLELESLNDGNGIRVNRALPDIGFVLRDGTAGNIEFSAIEPGGSEVSKEYTIGDILDTINAAAPGKLVAEIHADGDRLIVRDESGGEGTFFFYSLFDSPALADLGLDQPAGVDSIVGRRLLGGTGSVLLSSLDGGQGLGQLGEIEITNRAGVTAIVDLDGAETLDDVVNRINVQAVGVQARVNDARNGIALTDTTGATVANLKIVDLDAAKSAEKLGILVDDAVTSVNGGDLRLQIIAEHTLLSSLNGGKGVARGTLLIQDSVGNQAVLDLRDANIQTVGDVLTAIYALNVRVYADLNETGDGIRIRDLDGGAGELAVYEGETTTARDLGLFRTAQTVDIGGTPTQVIDGSMTRVIQLGPSDSLADLRQKINALDAGVAATLFMDGSSRPYRVGLISQQSGKQGELVVDTSQLGIGFQQTVRAQDALLLSGDPAAAATGILVSSKTNQFTTVLPGATLEIKEATGQSVTVSVGTTHTQLVAAVQSTADTYNKFRKRLQELTKYDSETDARGVLTGNSAALRLDHDLSYLISGQFLGAGTIRSLAEVGLSLKDDGTLVFDEAKLNEALAADPEAVRTFFTTAETGVSDRFEKAIDQFTAQDVSLMAQRYNALRAQIERNADRIETMNKILEMQQERLYQQFYRMESAIGKMQSTLNTISAIQVLSPLTSTS